MGIWAYWHVVRQHYGFMRLYQVKNGERSRTNARQDGLLMHLGLMLPFVVFVLRHPESRRAFGLSAQFPPWPSWEYVVFTAIAVLLAYLIASFVLREAGRVRRGEPLNVPKLLLFTAVLPLKMVVCFSQAVLLAMFFLGFPGHHYFVDQFIWKPSKDRNLQRDLNLDPATA